MSEVHEGHRERMKNTFRKSGLEHFHDHEALEMLLFYAIPRKDTNPLAHRLMDTFGSFSGVFDAPYELLREVEGISDHSATLLKFTAAVIRRYMEDQASENDVIKDEESAKEYMRYKFLCEPRECVYMACLGNNGKVIFCSRIADGSPDTVSIVPAQVVKLALRANAVRVLLAHNHPNGICIPSNRDLGTTSILWEELHRVDVELFDHIIAAPGGVYSMRESGMLPAGR